MLTIDIASRAILVGKMGTIENYSLKWEDFHSNVQQTFRTARLDESLCDVTLVCGDETFNAHKLVLSASSEYFKNLFRKCTRDNPMVVLKMTHLSQMGSLMDFIYKGEVKINHDNLQPFLEMANDLEIKGLSQFEVKSDGDTDKQHVYAPYSNSSSQLLQSHSTTGSSQLLHSSDIAASYEEICKVSLGYTEPVIKDDVASSLGSHDYQAIGGSLGSEDGIASISPGFGQSLTFRNGSWCCGKCGHADRSKYSMRDHMETHLGNHHTYFCSSCGKSFKTKSSMRLHKYKSHASEKLIQQLSYVM